jgi:flagellar capping protein FliD
VFKHVLFVSAAKKEKFPTTPPPIKKHSTVCSGKDVSNAATAAKAVEKQAQRKSTSSEYPLTKSKSQVELGNRIVNPSDVASSTVNSCASVSTPISHTMTSTSTITTATVSEHMEQLPRYSAGKLIWPLQPQTNIKYHERIKQLNWQYSVCSTLRQSITVNRTANRNG